MSMIHEFSLPESETILLPRLVDVCPDAIIGVNAEGRVVLFNQAAAALTGHAIEAVLGKGHIKEFYGGVRKAKAIKAAIYSEAFGGKNRLDGYDTEIMDAGGRVIPIRLSAALLMENGKEVGSVGFFHDLTRQKRLEEKLRLLSITDGMTGLYNQRHFYTCLTGELSRARRYKRDLSVIGFDLDNFKQCNDRYGHLEGDNVLRLVGNLLSSEMRTSDLSFRYGGDEFFVLLPETKLEHAHSTAEKILNLFNDRWPFESVENEKASFRVTLSIGVAQYTDEKDPQGLLKKVDMAMYTAKKAGGNRVVVHNNQI